MEKIRIVKLVTNEPLAFRIRASQFFKQQFSIIVNNLKTSRYQELTNGQDQAPLNLRRALNMAAIFSTGTFACIL